MRKLRHLSKQLSTYKSMVRDVNRERLIVSEDRYVYPLDEEAIYLKKSEDA